jgi:hypothetical protein
MFQGVIELTLGLISGSLITGVGFYLLLYKRLKNINVQQLEQLLRIQADSDKLANQLFQEQAQWQQERQAFDQRQAKLEADLGQLQTNKVNLEKLLGEKNRHWEEERQSRQRELEKLRQQLQRVMQEKMTVENHLQQKVSQWEQERHGLDFDLIQLKAELECLKEEKTALQTQLSEEREIWGRQELELKTQLMQVQEVNNSEEQVRLDDKLLQNPDDTNPYSQLIRLQTDKKALEKRLVTQKAHVEQAQQALKREIARRVHAEQTQQALKKEIAQLLNQLKQVRQE